MAKFKKGDRVKVTVEGFVRYDTYEGETSLNVSPTVDGASSAIVSVTRTGVTVERLPDPPTHGARQRDPSPPQRRAALSHLIWHVVVR